MSACETFPTATSTELVTSTVLATLTSISVSTLSAGSDPSARVTSIPSTYVSMITKASKVVSTLYGSSCIPSPSPPSIQSPPSPSPSKRPPSASTVIVTQQQTITSTRPGSLTTTFSAVPRTSASVGRTSMHDQTTVTAYAPSLQTVSSNAADGASPVSNHNLRIIGGAVGAICGALLFGGCLYFFVRRRKTRLSAAQLRVLDEAGMFPGSGRIEPKPYQYGHVGSPLPVYESPLPYPSPTASSFHHISLYSSDQGLSYYPSSLPPVGQANLLTPPSAMTPEQLGLQRNSTTSSATTMPPGAPRSTISHRSISPLLPPPPVLPNPPAPPADWSDADSVVLEPPRNAWRVTNPNNSQLFAGSDSFEQAESGWM